LFVDQFSVLLDGRWHGRGLFAVPGTGSFAGIAPDAYHELAHILLFRRERELVHPALGIVDRWFDKMVDEGTMQNWPQASRDELEQFRHRWRSSWLLEFASDLIATYLAGPSFGWCNIRTSTNIGGELFSGSDSHPADDARATGIGMMLDRIDCAEDAAAIAARWDELVKLANNSPPQRYELAYPEELLSELADFFQTKCDSLGLLQFDPSPDPPRPVTSAVNEAWRVFRRDPENFGQYEQLTLRTLVAAL
jgi:hypothetical protein